MPVTDARGLTDEQERREAEALQAVIQRLRRRFPELKDDEVHDVVHGMHAEFRGAPIRDFVPVLVENCSRDHLVARTRTASP